MSTPEEQELAARITNLASRINRHKQQGDPTAGNSSPVGRGSYRTAPYPRGGYRGGRGAYAPTFHRHKTLVMKTSNGPAASDTNSDDAGGAAWVSRTDRHLQLINTAVYEKNSQNRVSAIEQTQRQKQFQRDQMEKNSILNYVQRNGNRVRSAPSNTQLAASNYEVLVDGIRFRVTKGGSKLVRVPGKSSITSPRPVCAKRVTGENNPPSATAKVATIGGVKFYRTKNGNLVRYGVVKAQRYVPSIAGGHQLTMERTAGGIKKVNVPCKTFSWTGIVSSKFRNHQTRGTYQPRCGKTPRAITNCCLGSCSKGPRCRYMHNAARVAICRDWLLKDKCPHGEACDLSHEATEERTPLCMHFAKGKCCNDNCPFLHAEHSQADPVCREFGIYGFCDKGAKCPARHVFECPDFSNTGVCKMKGCKLLHRERASLLRKAADRDRSGNDEDMADLSSEEEDAGDSDDIDSDEVEEFIGGDGTDDVDFSTQNDFIAF